MDENQAARGGGKEERKSCERLERKTKDDLWITIEKSRRTVRVQKKYYTAKRKITRKEMKTLRRLWIIRKKKSYLSQRK